MAIVKEFFRTREDGVKLYRTYSDEHKMIIEETTGTAYDEAIDVETANYTYLESDIYVQSDDVDMDVIEKAKAYDILVGEVE